MKKEYHSPEFEFLIVELDYDVLSTSLPADENPASGIGGGGNNGPGENPDDW